MLTNLFIEVNKRSMKQTGQKRKPPEKILLFGVDDKSPATFERWLQIVHIIF